jgi:putative SOS response-associated peptidase YedK
MCGRYVTISTPDQLTERFDVQRVAVDSLRQVFNVAPTLQVPVIVDRDGERTLDTMRWGFVPFWAKQLGKGAQPINARVEGVAENKMFSSAFRKRRLLLPADGFYEWQKRPNSSKKQPWYIHDPQNRPLAFAGIWSTWTNRESGETVESTAILTRKAAGRMSDLHHRMPVVLPGALWATWLEDSEKDAPYLDEVIQHAGIPDLTARTVTDRVNNVRNDGPDLIATGTVEDD